MNLSIKKEKIEEASLIRSRCGKHFVNILCQPRTKTLGFQTGIIILTLQQITFNVLPYHFLRKVWVYCYNRTQKNVLHKFSGLNDLCKSPGNGVAKILVSWNTPRSITFSLEKFVMFDHDTKTLLDFIWFCACAVDYSTNAVTKVKASIAKEMLIGFTLCPALTNDKLFFCA